MNRQEKAADLFKEGYNCAQAVLAAFDDVLEIDQEVLLNLAIPFGAGFGRTRNLCGTVSAFGLVLGLYRNKNKMDPKDKTSVYKQIQELDKEFKEINGSDCCFELLKNIKSVTAGYVPQERDAAYYAERPCLKFVIDSVGILEKALNL